MDGETTQSRRTSAERKTAEAVLNTARKAKPASADKFARAKRYSDAAVKSQRHESHYSHSSIDGTPIKYFYRDGDFITGTLGECQSEAFQASSYPLVLDSGRVVRVPGNRRLRLAIEKADAIGQRVTITYKGKLFKKGGHYEKCYLVELSPLSKEKNTAAGESVLDRLAADLAAQKSVSEGANE